MPHSVWLAPVEEVPLGSMKTFQVEGKSILIANVEGKVSAIGAVCNHEQWDLSEGSLEGEEVVCAGHGAVWNLRTGEGKFPLPLPREPIYNVEISGGQIYVDLE